MKKPTKSQRRRPTRVPRSRRKRASGPRGQEVDVGQLIRERLVAEIRGTIAALAHQLVEDEVLSLVGERWSRKGDSPLRRNGSTSTSIFLDGEPHLLHRARVRDQDANSEHVLETVEALRDRDALDEEVKALLVRGISTRNYEGALTSLSDGLGLKKSAVSAAFQRASRKDLDALNGRSLAEWKFAAVYIDGTGFADHMCVAVIGVEIDGTKRILGIREGASENAVVVRDLLENLVERGLTLTHRALFVLDGSKALRKGVRDVFGERALIQRCQVHKLRNVLAYLPPARHTEARRRIRAAWGLVSHREARSELRKVHRWLKGISESAAASLAEGMEETITVHRLGVTGALRRTLVTTNPIESAFDLVKSNARRVKRWSGAAMVLRWVGTGLLKAERQFRRVMGHAAMHLLVAALESASLSDDKAAA